MTDTNSNVQEEKKDVTTPTEPTEVKVEENKTETSNGGTTETKAEEKKAE